MKSASSSSNLPLVSVVMGSQSAWQTMKVCADQLTQFSVNVESQIVSAHRTPDLLFEYAKNAKNRGIKVIIAGAGGAAHLPGMIASQTTIPVIGVPIQSKALNGLDSLLSIVQMPAGIAVATVAIGEAGAKNAALLAISILAIDNSELSDQLIEYRKNQTNQVLAHRQLQSVR